jgi:hypothetical protein
MSNIIQNLVLSSVITSSACSHRSSMCLALPLFRLFSHKLTSYNSKIEYYKEIFTIHNDHDPQEFCASQYRDNLFGTLGVMLFSKLPVAIILSAFIDEFVYHECIHFAGEYTQDTGN